MNKVNIIGEQAWHVFEDEKGTKFQIECSLEEYDALALLNPVNPTMKGLTWTHSYKDWMYDTPSGRLEDNCFVEFEDKTIYKLPGDIQRSTLDANTIGIVPIEIL